MSRIPFVLSTLSRRPRQVKSRQLSRFLFNRFQLSSDARPQGAVSSTASLRSAWFIRIALGRQGRPFRAPRNAPT